MQTAIIVQGRLVGPTTIELDEPVSLQNGAVEIVMRASTRTTAAQPQSVDAAEGHPSLLEIIDSFPPRGRSKEEIDAELNAERDSWE